MTWAAGNTLVEAGRGKQAGWGQQAAFQWRTCPLPQPPALLVFLFVCCSSCVWPPSTVAAAFDARAGARAAVLRVGPRRGFAQEQVRHWLQQAAAGEAGRQWAGWPWLLRRGGLVASSQAAFPTAPTSRKQLGRSGSFPLGLRPYRLLCGCLWTPVNGCCVLWIPAGSCRFRLIAMDAYGC